MGQVLTHSVQQCNRSTGAERLGNDCCGVGILDRRTILKLAGGAIAATVGGSDAATFDPFRSWGRVRAHSGARNGYARASLTMDL
jgi:hypothetical protein